MKRIVIGLVLLSGIFEVTRVYSLNQWATTRLDGNVTVDMPYEGSLTEDSSDKSLELQRYITSTSDNRFEAIRIALRQDSANLSSKNVQVTVNIDRFLRNTWAASLQRLTKAKLQKEGPMGFPLSPGIIGQHRTYHVFNEYTQEPEMLEVIWVSYNRNMYFFSCSNSLPEESGSTEDKLRFFSTIHFN